MNTKNEELIINLIKKGYLKSKRVINTLSKVDRFNFCPKFTECYEDCPQYLGYGVKFNINNLGNN
jgi:hypothetical protein